MQLLFCFHGQTLRNTLTNWKKCVFSFSPHLINLKPHGAKQPLKSISGVPQNEAVDGDSAHKNTLQKI